MEDDKLGFLQAPHILGLGNTLQLDYDNVRCGTIRLDDNN